MYPETIEIYVSKWKTALLCLGAAVFVVLGILMIRNPASSGNSRYDPSVIYMIGVVAVLFFGLALVYGISKLFQKRPAYIINSAGLVYDTRNPDVHTLKWDEINGLGVMTIKRTKTILISVADPDALIARQTSGIKRNLMRMSVNQYNAPISISTNSLSLSHSQLLELLENYHGSYLKQRDNQAPTHVDGTTRQL